MKVVIRCDMCGKEVLRYPSCIKAHNFCSRACLAAFSNKAKNPERYAQLKNYEGMSIHMTALNRTMNPKRMTHRTRSKLRQARLGAGSGKANYTKYYGESAHRVAAEKKLGRKLLDGETVHHLDFNGMNNDPSNLMVFKCKSDHSKYHANLNRFFDLGEICDPIEEVMPL